MSTSKLQRYTSEQLYKRFGKYGLVENTRPRWLVSSKGERLELDFFIDKLSIAIEVQGRQHVGFTPCFHATEYDFAEQLRRDREKKDLCDNANIQLFYVYDKTDVEIVLYGIYTQVQRQLDTRGDVWIDNDNENLRATLQCARGEKATLAQQERYEKNYASLPR